MKKICKCCERNRRLERFGKRSSSPDGLNYYCKECMRKMRKAYKCKPIGILRQRKANKRWEKKNKEHKRAYNKEYYRKNKDRIIYNKLARETTECVLIRGNPQKSKQLKINKSREVCIEINPKRK